MTFLGAMMGFWTDLESVVIQSPMQLGTFTARKHGRFLAWAAEPSSVSTDDILLLGSHLGREVVASPGFKVTLTCSGRVVGATTRVQSADIVAYQRTFTTHHLVLTKLLERPFSPGDLPLTWIIFRILYENILCSYPKGAIAPLPTTPHSGWHLLRIQPYR